MEKTGWTYDQTVAKVEEAKAKVGITFYDYNKYNFHKVAEKDQEKKYEEILIKKQKQKERAAAARERCIIGVINATGWSRELVEAKLDETRKRTDCTYNEYLLYRLFDLTPEEQDQVPLMSFTTKQLSKKFNTNPEFAKMLDDKARTNEFFSEFVRRPWCVNTEVSLNNFKKTFAKSKKIIYKPIEGIGGHDICIFELNNKNMVEVFSKLVMMPKGVVEEYVIQHPEMNRLCPTSVNTLRIVTMSSKTKPVTADGKYVDIAYGALRIGGGTDVVDNIHSGGMAASVDLATGELITDATNKQGDTFIVHPMTGAKIKGFKIPYFEEAIQMIKDICAKDGVEGNLGWDICITETGPALIEANRYPGVVLLVAPNVAERKGMMKHVFEKYL